MKKEVNYQKTIYACFTAYIVQAVINNFVPLLFLTFQSQYQIPLSKITLLITFNFGLQLIVDLLSAVFVDKIGYRISTVAAHGCAALGLILLTVLPEVLPDPFIGVLLSVMIYALGGGLIEVLVSPIVEACPTDNKEKAMSLLHSFYCWGHVGVVLLSTLFFSLFGIENWKAMALLWSLVPIVNAAIFTKVPILHLIGDGEQGFSVRELVHKKVFWLFILLMLCAGASEQAVSQWASAFAEQGLGVGKVVGDLAGPMAFAVLMGTSRAIYGKWGEKIPLEKFMVCSGILCVLSYLTIVFVPNPLAGLIGCALCGLSVGIMWPGTFSMASARMQRGGTALFAFLALAGDLGCCGGPSLVGYVSSRFGENLRIGILAAAVFPILLILGVIISRKKNIT